MDRSIDADYCAVIVDNMGSNFLKPCPFCGDTYIKTRRFKEKYTIGCNTVNCICLHTVGKTFDDEEDAIRAWNRRASDGRNSEFKTTSINTNGL